MAFSAPSPHFPPTLAGASRGAVMGASFEENALNRTLPAPSWTTGGWVAWLRRYAKGAIDLPASRVFATGGFTSTDVINTWLGPCVAAKPAWCFVDVTTNDFNTTSDRVFTNAKAIDNLTTIITALMNAGIYVILVPVRIFGSGYDWAGHPLLLRQVSYLNQWMKTFCENNTGATYWDVNPLFLDFSTGYAQDDLLSADPSDGHVHDSTRGAQLRGLSAWNLISSLFPARDSRFMLLGDKYDATYNPTGNLLPNGLFAGTGGSAYAPSGATGQVADNWTVVGGGGSVSPVASKTAYAGYLGLDKQTITLSGPADGKTCLFFPSNPLSNWSVGDTVVAEVEVDWNITSGQVLAVYALLAAQSGGNLAWDGADTGYGELNSGGAYRGGDIGQSIVLRLEPVTIAAGVTAIDFSCGIKVGPLNSGTVGVTVNWARASLRKVF